MVNEACDPVTRSLRMALLAALPVAMVAFVAIGEPHPAPRVMPSVRAPIAWHVAPRTCPPVLYRFEADEPLQRIEQLRLVRGELTLRHVLRIARSPVDITLSGFETP